MLPAEHIVEGALREYCAFRTVRRALLNWMQRRKMGKGFVRGTALLAGKSALPSIQAYPKDELCLFWNTITGVATLYLLGVYLALNFTSSEGCVRCSPCIELPSSPKISLLGV